MLFAIMPAALAADSVTASPVVTEGSATIIGNNIYLVKGTDATIAFQPSENLDVFEYQSSISGPSDKVTVIEQDLSDDYLVPSAKLDASAVGSYTVNVAISKNIEEPEYDAETVWEQEYNVTVSEVSVAPSVQEGNATIDGDKITLTQGEAATIAFNPTPDLDPIMYQYSLANPVDVAVEDKTDIFGEYLVPTYQFTAAETGTQTITLTLTENGNYATVFQKEYTLEVVAPTVSPSPTPEVTPTPTPEATPVPVPTPGDTTDEEVEIVTEGNVPEVTVAQDKETVKDMLLTEEEIANGYDVALSVKEVEPSAEQQALFDEALDGRTQVLSLDITPYKLLNGSVVGTISETNGMLRLTIEIPEEYRAADRAFVMIREHDGAMDVLKDLDTDPNTITFETNQFSLYTLAYSTVTTSTIPQTSDNAMIGLTILVALASAGVAVIALKKRHAER